MSDPTPITEAELDELRRINSSGTPGKWRAGRKVGRTLYSASDLLMGVMDHAMDAKLVVAAVNALPRLLEEVRHLGALHEMEKESRMALGKIIEDFIDQDHPKEETEVTEILWHYLPGRYTGEGETRETICHVVSGDRSTCGIDVRREHVTGPWRKATSKSHQCKRCLRALRL